MTSTDLHIEWTPGETVTAVLDAPEAPVATYVFAHGAGAGMRHVFMEAITARLLDRSVAVLRYQFPYMEAGSRRPDRPDKLVPTVAAACAAALERAPAPVWIGGKSMGGRMSTTWLATGEAPADVRGVACIGFPLHPAGRPGITRAAHLADVDRPMLFVNGTRDKLADLDLLEPVCADLGPRATLHVVDGADHAFHVLKRSGRTDDEVLDEIADVVATWMREGPGLDS